MAARLAARQAPPPVFAADPATPEAAVRPPTVRTASPKRRKRNGNDGQPDDSDGDVSVDASSDGAEYMPVPTLTMAQRSAAAIAEGGLQGFRDAASPGTAVRHFIGTPGGQDDLV